MSVLSDIRDLYGTVEAGWASGRAQLLTHAIAALVLFAICGVTLPEFHLPDIDPRKIADNDWFKLAKDTGAVYVGFLIPIVLVAVYLAVLRQLGQLWLGVTGILMTGRLRDPFVGMSEWELEPIALLMNKDEFTLEELFNKTTTLVVKFDSKKPELWSTYRKNVQNITQSSAQYFGDFSAFLVIWVGLFIFFAHTQWAAENRARFWPVSLLLLILVVISWLRVSKAIQATVRMQLSMTSTVIRLDTDLFPIADIPDEKREKVREKLRSLLDERRSKEREEVTLNKLVRARFGLASDGPTPVRELPKGWPFPGFYARGRMVAYPPSAKRRDIKNANIYAYVYYRVYERLSGAVSTAAALLKYTIFGGL